MRPIAIMPKLTQYCHVIIGNLWAANTLLGIQLCPSIKAENVQAEYVFFATETSNNIFKTFPKCNWVAKIFRFDKVEGISYYATLNNKLEQSLSPFFKADKIVDKVGSGDCFMAGLIHGIVTNNSPHEIINFAAPAALPISSNMR